MVLWTEANWNGTSTATCLPEQFRNTSRRFSSRIPRIQEATMKYSLRSGLALALMAVLPSVSLASLPTLGVQPTFFGERDRIACDSFEQVKALYDAGKDNPFIVHKKMEELNASSGESPNGGGPVCVVGKYPNATVKEVSELGPLTNPVGDAKLSVYAVKVDTSAIPQMKMMTFYIFFIDATDAYVKPSADIPPSGRDEYRTYIILPDTPSLFRRIFG